jgi:CCR4-NOT transcription complex subunit 6
MAARNSSWVVATYNVLATAYIQRSRYPRTPALVLDPAWRVPALAQHISSFEADVICLQEVESETFSALRSRLGSRGHAAHYARKNGGSPDGCATFFRQDALRLLDEKVVRLADREFGRADSGNIALITILDAVGRRLGLINTHLTWDPPGSARESQLGLRQARQLLLEYEDIAASAEAWIIAGDLNATPDGEIISLMEASGFRCAHAGHWSSNTCSFNGAAKKIDYLLHSPTLQAEPYETCPVDAQTVLPSPEQPSDHVVLGARFEWRI